MKGLRWLIFVFFVVFMGVNYAHSNDQDENKVNDKMLVSQIKKKLSNDKLLNQSSIVVGSKNGEVTLKGQLDTDMQCEQAVMLAESVQGVKNVEARNLTATKSKQPLKDLLITAKIKGKIIQAALFGNKDVKYWTVSIETNNGVVYLSGHVDNQQQKANLLKLMRAVKDVKSVKADTLTIAAVKNERSKQ